MEAWPNNLPAPVSSFIGREREIAEITRLLSASRLVTLTGAGGCGKTRLALEVASTLRRDAMPGDVPTECQFGHGAWFVDLAPIADPALIPERVAATFDIAEQPSQPVLTTLVQLLRAKQLLIVLDNCEHLIEACAQLAGSLLQACPNLSMLVTSREPLNISGELTFVVQPLAVPDPQHLPPFETLPQFAAVRLFVERARAARSGFALTPKSANLVATICVRLDGMPLAIELAAARINVLSLEQVAERLDDRFQLLTGGRRGALPRQQTLRATIDWSFQLLTEPERVLLRRLSVFAGGWTLEAAEAVCADEPTARTEPTLMAAQILDLMVRLVEKSLVVTVEGPGESRYRMLETIRQYAIEHQSRGNESERLAERHLWFYLALAERAEPSVRSGQRAPWLDRLEADHDNLRAALRWSVTAGEIESGMCLAGYVFWFWRLHNHTAEARRWYTTLLAQDQQRAPTVGRALATYGAGHMAWWHGDRVAGRAFGEESAVLWRALGNRQRLAYTLFVVAYIAAEQGDLEPGYAWAKEGVDLFRALGDQWGLASALCALDMAQRACGDLASAWSSAEESVALFRQLADPWMAGIPLGHLGVIAIAQRDFVRAKALLTERAAIHRKVGDKRLTSSALYYLGQALWGLGEYEQAEATYREGLQFMQEFTADPIQLAQAWRHLGRAARENGSPSRAAEYYQRGLAALGETLEESTVAHLLDQVAVLLVLLGRLFSAARLLGVVDKLMHGAVLSANAFYRGDHDKASAVARAGLSRREFERAWAEGQKLTAEQAVAEAKQVLRDSTINPPPAAHTAPAYPAGLSAREVEVLRLLAQALTDAQIAEALTISPRTVNGHLYSIYRKLDVTNRTAAARYAAELKLS